MGRVHHAGTVTSEAGDLPPQPGALNGTEKALEKIARELARKNADEQVSANTGTLASIGKVE